MSDQLPRTSLSRYRIDPLSCKRQAGLSLIELLLALALTAMLGVMIASLISGWVDLRERTAEIASPDAEVLEFCLLLEQRFDALTQRALQEQRLALNNGALVWRGDENRLEWVSGDGLAAAALLAGRSSNRQDAGTTAPLSGAVSNLRRQALSWEPELQQLVLHSSADLDAVGNARWQPIRRLDAVSDWELQFYHNARWLAYPATDGSAAGVRLRFNRAGQPYVCTFALPATD